MLEQFFSNKTLKPSATIFQYNVIKAKEEEFKIAKVLNIQ